MTTKPFVRFAVRAALAAVVAGFLVVTPATVVGANAGTTQVAGLMEPDTSGSCPDTALFAYVVSGTLKGCWYVDRLDFDHTSAAGGFVASGTEHFVGSLGDLEGSFNTTYTFTAKFAGDTEVHGRCHHPIIGGDGDFAGITGVIDMHDLPNGCAEYQGHLAV